MFKKASFPLIILFIIFIPYKSFSAPKEQLFDRYYTNGFNNLTVHLCYGGVNSSTKNKALQDLRGGGIELEYERLSSSKFFSGALGFGYLTLNDSSSSQDRYVKNSFLKIGFNYFFYSLPNFLHLKIGPDVRLALISALDKEDSPHSYGGAGIGVTLAASLAINSKWYVGGGIREGILSYSDEELKTRYFSINVQRTF